MKLVTALVHPDSLDHVKEALQEAGVTGLTVTLAQGFGRRGGETTIYRGSELKLDLIPRARLEMVVADRDEAERIVNVLRVATFRGEASDGKVWVGDVDWLVSLRTGEMNTDAI